MSKNHLAQETSPYLLQHQDNPVHWYSWGSNAFNAARENNKPILLSIGYAACHWCHVMAHESFEDQATAELMNRLFINIKVDREERPDIDKIYMDAIHALGEQGGWPLTIFLDHDAKPFWGGTYFPKTSQYGRPSFTHILTEINRIWHEEHEKVTANGSAIIDALKPDDDHRRSELNIDKLNQSAKIVLNAIDLKFGGLKGAPKFPQTQIIELLWRYYLRSNNDTARLSVITTLTKLCQGGIYDHLAGGFSRYTVDHLWLVPHFEKMLYDNALILQQLSYVLTPENSRLFRYRIDETICWLQHDMMAECGIFTSSFDADSEGEEGQYYIWDKQEISQIVPSANLNVFLDSYDVSDAGNWEGKTILNRLKSDALGDEAFEATLKDSRETLLAIRNNRPPPARDDKCLSNWNALAISALTHIAMVSVNKKLLDQVCTINNHLLTLMWNGKILQHSHCNGETRHLATADGYANLITTNLILYQATADNSYLTIAQDLTTALETNFSDDAGEAFYFSSCLTTDLILRSLYVHDDAVPNANATMLANYTRLHIITGKQYYGDRASKLHHRFADKAIDNPIAHAGFLCAAELHINAMQAIIFAPENTSCNDDMIHALWQYAGPDLTIIHLQATDSLDKNHPAYASVASLNQPTILICHGQTCFPGLISKQNIVDFFKTNK